MHDFSMYNSGYYSERWLFNKAGIGQDLICNKISPQEKRSQFPFSSINFSCMRWINSPKEGIAHPASLNFT